MARRSRLLLAALTIPLIFGVLLVVVVAQSLIGGLLARLVAFGLAGAVAWWIARVRQVPIRVLGWTRPGWGSVLGGLAVGAGLVALVAGVLAATDGYVLGWRGDWGFLLGAFMFAIPIGLYEEALFRSIWFGGLEPVLGTWAALASSSIFFGLLHFFNPEATLVSSIAIAVTAGVLLGAMFIAKRDLWLVAAVHAAWNATLGGFFGMPVSGSTLDGAVLTATESGPDLWTGGAFGPEASLASILIVGGVAVWYLGRIGSDAVVAPSWQAPAADA